MAEPLRIPVLLTPKALEKPWGGRRMESVFGRKLPPTAPIGEMWEVFDRGGASSVVRGGPLDGTPLSALRGETPFPLLVKILDASEALSIQVHPDDKAAARLNAARAADAGRDVAPGSPLVQGKTECWFILHAEPGAKVWRGLKEGVGERELREALARGSVEECVHSFEVKTGDTVFVPAGTVHSIGAGVVLAEVQQNSDTTFRLWDWGRPRPLHVDEALASIHFGPRSPDKVPAQITADDGTVQRALLVQCRFFTAEAIAAMGTFTLDVPHAPNGVPAVLHMLSGKGTLRPFRRGVAPVHFDAGDTLLLPPEDEEFEIEPGASVVRALMFRG